MWNTQRKQESIPVGFVSSAPMAVGRKCVCLGGVCPGGGVYQGWSAKRVCPGGVCLGVSGWGYLLRGCLPMGRLPMGCLPRWGVSAHVGLSVQVMVSAQDVSAWEVSAQVVSAQVGRGGVVCLPRGCLTRGLLRGLSAQGEGREGCLPGGLQDTPCEQND